MRALLISLTVVLSPSLALAQGPCPGGMVAVDEAHCCWLGQSFSAARQGCVGAPQCPAGMVPYGEACVLAPSYVVPPPPPAYGVPPPAMGPRSPARFEAKKDGKFKVVMDTGEICETPCELSVSAGRHHVTIEGDATFQEKIDFPAAPSVVKIEKRRGGRMALGIAGLAGGIPMAAVGGMVAVLGALFGAERNSYPYDSTLPTRSTADTMVVVGASIAAAGVVFIGVGAGVGFGTAGRNRARLENAPEQHEEASLQLVGLGAAPTRGGAVLGATFAF